MGQHTDFESERRQLTRKAWGVTIAYVVVLLVLACLPLVGEPGVDAYLDMKPNEVGDLLAGIAGPVAFIWLVYGYFLQGIAIRQQAEELGQNTRALHLQEEALRAQAEELNNSVEQQRQLVEISRSQLHDERIKAEQDRADRIASAQPVFVLKITEISRYRDGHSVLAELVNIGKLAVSIDISTSSQLYDFSPMTLSSLTPEGTRTLYWRQVDLSKSGKAHLSIAYTDVFGGRSMQSFELSPGSAYEKNGSISVRPISKTNC